jgi:hypothetical protein
LIVFEGQPQFSFEERIGDLKLTEHDIKVAVCDVVEMTYASISELRHDRWNMICGIFAQRRGPLVPVDHRVTVSGSGIIEKKNGISECRLPFSFWFLQDFFAISAHLHDFAPSSGMPTHNHTRQ